MNRILRKALALAAVGAALALGAYGCGGGGSSGGSAQAPTGSATLTATVERSPADRRVQVEELAPVDVAAVDHHGDKVDEALGVTGPFALDLPWGRDYVLIFADGEGLLGAMVYGEKEQTRFSVEPGVLAVDLGQILIDAKSRVVRLKDPRRVKPPRGDDDDDDDDDDDGPRPGTGDAAVGALLWQDHCAGCHPAGLEETSVEEMAEVLREGDGSMPAFPELVGDAAHLAAYLRNPVEVTDTDGDGVADDWDACPGVAGQGADGCPPSPPADTDGDGVTDDRDVCPNLAGEGADGCPLPAPADADGDGVTDDLDACPNVAGDGADGCPLPTPTDTDGDGVTDDRDACPNVAGDGADGCPLPPLDTDGDGVPDDLDTCPDVPAATPDGCPLPPPPADRDGDGVPDTSDRCANTPLGVTVDATGCPLDRDGDRVPDYLDACPTQAGTGADGCPVIPPPPPPPARPAILDTLCLGCHGNFSSRVSCGNSQWPRHNGARSVSAAQYQEVSTWATGGTCP